MYGTYWNDGQLKTVVQASTTLASYSYDGQGRLQQVTRANGASTGYGYDGVDRLQALSTTVGSTLLSSFQYQVDRLGQRTLVTETISTPSLTTRSLSYSYDGLLRLTGVQEQPGSVYTYTYDFVGNRLSAAIDATSTTWSYDAADQVSTTGWSYDAAGNLLSDGSSSYSYDALNRLMSASQGTISQTYSYNGDGTLVAQTTGSTTTWYSQDLALPLSQILQSKGSVTTTYLYGTERLASVTGTTRAWYATDGLGSVRQLLSDAGTVTTANRYDAWGTPVGGTTPTTFGFTGEYQDASLGLVYLRARWYNTTTGRFLTHDPWTGRTSEPLSFNKYAYVHDDPLNAIDPSGLRRFRIWASAFIALKSVIFPYPYSATVSVSPGTGTPFIPNEGGPLPPLFPGYGTPCPALIIDPGVDLNAIWEGNNRNFSTNGERSAFSPESKVWHETILDIDDTKMRIVANDTNVDHTIVSYHRANNPDLLTAEGYAELSPRADIGRDASSNIITVRHSPFVYKYKI